MLQKIGSHWDIINPLWVDADGKSQVAQDWAAKSRATVNKIIVNPLHWHFPIDMLKASSADLVIRIWLTHYDDRLGDDFQTTGLSGDPFRLAQLWVDTLVRNLREKAPEILANADYKNRLYFEAFNELNPAPGDDSILLKYSMFETARQEMMAAHGLRCCIINASSGTPHLQYNPPYKAEWIPFMPALQACHKYKNLLGLHEYAGVSQFWGVDGVSFERPKNSAEAQAMYFPDVQPEHEGWGVLRHRKVWNKYIQRNDMTDIRIVINEAGFDKVWTIEVGREYDDILDGDVAGAWGEYAACWNADGFTEAEQHYTNQMIHLNTALNQTDYVLGATIFTFGTIDPQAWQGHDIINTTIPGRLAKWGATVS